MANRERTRARYILPRPILEQSTTGSFEQIRREVGVSFRAKASIFASSALVALLLILLRNWTLLFVH